MTYSLLHVQGWIERLLARGVAPDEPDATGWTPLHWAASNDRREAATALMRGGAEIDKRNESGSTALFWATTPEMARLLLVHGASPGEKDEDGHNPEEWHLLLGRSVLRPAIL